MAYAFDFDNQLIEVTNPQVVVDIQELHDAIRTAETSEEGIQYPKIANASGKESLGGAVAVGITLELLDNWQVHFWEGNYIAEISGGNLVGGPADDPVAYTAGVQVLLILSAASTVVETGGTSLTQDEHDQLMAGALEATTQGIKAKTDLLPASPAATGDAMALTDAAVDAIIADMVTALTATGKTPAEALRILLAHAAGVTSGMGEGTPAFEAIDGSGPVISGVVDEDGNRTEVTIT